uniref:Transposase n=1 Tax=Heterorhabditis bacteriophora TaxID=37862 RepID=A0A1I7W9G7_HETBA
MPSDKELIAFLGELWINFTSLLRQYQMRFGKKICVIIDIFLHLQNDSS